MTDKNFENIKIKIVIVGIQQFTPIQISVIL